MLVIDKEKAFYLRSKLKNVCIVKTNKQKGGKCGHYMVEETNAVLNLLKKFDDQLDVSYEYPASK